MQQEIQENRKRNNEAVASFKDAEHERKIAMRMAQQDKIRRKQQNFHMSQSMHETSLREDFSKRQSSNKDRSKQNVTFVSPALHLQMKELEDKEAGMIEKLKHTFQVQQNSFHHFETVANSGKRPAYSPGATSPRGFFAPSQLNNDDAMSQRSQETARPEMGDRLGRLLDGEKKAKTELEEIEALLKMGGVSLIAQKLGKSSPRTGATSPRPVQVKSKKKEASVPAKKEPVKKPAAVPKAAPKPEPVVAAPPKAEPAPPKPAVVEESEAPAPAPPAKAEEPLSPEEENKPGDTELPAAQREALDEE